MQATDNQIVDNRWVFPCLGRECRQRDRCARVVDRIPAGMTDFGFDDRGCQNSAEFYRDRADFPGREY